MTTGGKPKLLGTSKRGNRYLRKKLIDGARAVLPYLAKHDTPLGRWVQGLVARAHKNKVVVALANKLARISSSKTKDQRMASMIRSRPEYARLALARHGAAGTAAGGRTRPLARAEGAAVAMAWHRLRETEIDALVHAGVLKPESRGKPDAILIAFMPILGKRPVADCSAAPRALRA